jgi:hypothetical protein
MVTYPYDREPQVVLERIPYDPVAWDAIVVSHEDAEVYHTAAWLEFLAATQGRSLSWRWSALTGAPSATSGADRPALRRASWAVRCEAGAQSVWASFSTTGSTGARAADALIPFAFHDLRCLHIELADRKLSSEQMEGSTYGVSSARRTRSTWHSQRTPCCGPCNRRLVRRSARQSAVGSSRRYNRPSVCRRVPCLSDRDLLRQGIGPTYGVERVRQLIESLRCTRTLLLLRVRSPEGKVLAAGISVGGRRVAVSWGSVMDRSEDDLNPAQLLWWETIRHWRERHVVL